MSRRKTVRSPRFRKYVGACGKIVIADNEGDAIIYLLNSQYGSGFGGTRYYYCKECNGKYHLTSKPKRNF
ncbi:hypothetical protein SEA_FRANCOB_92 [Streptomyces phage Francob]